MGQLTNNFSYEEMTRSITARNRGIENIPDAMQIASLRMLCIKVLQPCREYLDEPIVIQSGFRSKKLNKRIGGAKNSQHTRGEAADINCRNNKAVFDYIRDNLPFDQLIWEFGNDDQPEWIHVSHVLGENRGEVLRALKKGDKTVYRYV